MRTSIRFFLLASACALTACAGKAQPVTQNGEPVAAQQPATSAPAAMQVTTTPAPITDNEAGIYARLARLEADVSDMRTQMSSMGPVLEKMPALQDKLSELVTELKRIDARVASAQAHAETLPAPAVPAAKPAATPKPTALAPVEPTVKPAPAKGLNTAETTPTPEVKPTKGIPLKTAAAPDPAPAAAKTTMPSVTGVRLGDDASKTRIVLDLSQKVGFSYDLDNTEKILVIDLDAAGWNADPAASFAKSPIVASYTTQSVEGGKYRLIMQLRASARVLATQTLLPNGEKGDRIVVDLVKDGV